jgi:hypothetical protein
LIENSKFVKGAEEFGAHIPISPQEEFVNNIYAALDAATARELDRLENEEGILPRCELGCFHCCRCNILTNIAEAHALAQYIRREFSPEQLDSLRLRTQQWHEWDDSRPGRHPSAEIGEQTGLSSYDHCCPLVVDGVCSAYSVRPVVCRTHLVSSPPSSCYRANDPDSTEEAPAMLRSVVIAASPFIMAMQEYIENQGVDFSRSKMLLPQWLAIEMGWDFAILL